MIIYLPDISKSNLPMKLWGDKIVYKYSGDKTCCVYLAVYNVLYLCISAPLSEARLFYTFATEAGIHPYMHCF